MSGFAHEVGKSASAAAGQYPFFRPLYAHFNMPGAGKRILRAIRAGRKFRFKNTQNTKTPKQAAWRPPAVRYLKRPAPVVTKQKGGSCQCEIEVGVGVIYYATLLVGAILSQLRAPDTEAKTTKKRTCRSASAESASLQFRPNPAQSVPVNLHLATNKTHRRWVCVSSPTCPQTTDWAIRSVGLLPPLGPSMGPF